MATSDGTGPESQWLPDEVVDDLIADDRCRRTLSVLATRSEPVAIDDLAAAVRAREVGTDPGSIAADDRRRVRRELFQRHLPKLTAIDVVGYDSVLGTVELTEERMRDVLRDG